MTVYLSLIYGLLQIWVYRLDFVADLGVYPFLLQIWVYVLRLVADLGVCPLRPPASVNSCRSGCMF